MTNQSGQPVNVDRYELDTKNDETESYVEFTEEVFEEYFSDDVQKLVKSFQPKVSFGKPSEEYLISEEDLNSFSQDIRKNKL